MIRYTLICDKDHQFESWFQSSSAFERLAAAGHLTCAECGSGEVRLGLMTPSVASTSAPPDLATPQSDAQTALAHMRKKVEDNSDYVGQNFAQEARKMHDGDAPARAIYGEAKLADAKKLIEDGVPVAPLPFVPKRKSN